MKLKEKITDIFKEKKLISKFTDIESSISFTDETKKTTPLSYEEIQWNLFVEKKKYNNWKLEYFHQDLIEFFKIQDTKIKDIKFLKSKKFEKKIQIKIQVANTVNTQGLFMLICTTDFNQNLSNPIIEKIDTAPNQYLITFDINEQRVNYESTNTKKEPKQRRSINKLESTF